MDIGSVSQGFIQFFLLVASVATGTIHSGEPLSPVPEDYIAGSTTYQYELAGPIVQEATVSGQFDSIIITQEEVESTDSATLTSTPSPTPTVSVLQAIKTTVPTDLPTKAPLSILSPTPTPTSTPWPTHTPTPTPTIVKLPKIAEPEADVTENTTHILLNIPAAAPVSTEQSLSPDIILGLINDHRATKNLSPLVKDEQLCKLAEYRRPQLYDEIFTTKTVHKGLYDLHLPYYITENMAHYPSEQKVVSWWLGSRIHRAAIEGNYTYTCGTCSGNSCAQLFTNYTPKSTQ